MKISRSPSPTQRRAYGSLRASARLRRASSARRGKRGRPALGLAPANVESVRLEPELRDQLLERAKTEGHHDLRGHPRGAQRLLKAA